MSRRDRLLGLGVLLAGVLAVGFLAVARPPAIPSQPAGAPLARTVVELGHGGECLARVERGSGWADVCWAVDRDPAVDGSEVQDSYQLKLTGSFEGLKWLVVLVDLVGQPNGGAYASWPKGPIEGQCRPVGVHLGLTIGVEPTETLCGRTEGDLEPVSWVQRVTWTCELCLLPDAATKALAMYGQIAVDEGTIPAWDVFVDGGS